MQKIYAHIVQYTSRFFSAAPVKQFIKQSFYLGAFLSLSLYTWVRLLFHDIPFEMLRETAMVLDMLFTGCCLSALCIACFSLLMLAADCITAKQKQGTMRTANQWLIKGQRNHRSLAAYDLPAGRQILKIDNNGQLCAGVKCTAIIPPVNTGKPILQNKAVQKLFSNE